MSTNIDEAVFAQMKMRTFYRPNDLASETNIRYEYVAAALRNIAREGAIDRIVDGRRVVYITRQAALF